MTSHMYVYVLFRMYKPITVSFFKYLGTIFEMGGGRGRMLTKLFEILHILTHNLLYTLTFDK